MRINGLLAAVMICFGANFAALPGAVAQTAQPSSGGTISVQGQGTVASAPDTATITLGVNTEAESAVVALQTNNRDTAAVLALLKGLGIADEDMQTSQLSLNPVWDLSSNSRRPEITRYQVTNVVTVVVRDLPTLGQVLDQVVAVGANAFHGLQFGLTQSDDLRSTARRLAVADARALAELYAEAAGVKLGRLLSLTESGGFNAQPMLRMEAMAAEGVPVAAGQVGIAVTVNMVYEIAP